MSDEANFLSSFLTGCNLLFSEGDIRLQEEDASELKIGAVIRHPYEIDSYSLDGSKPFTIGAFPRPGFGAGFLADEIAIFKRALSKIEIQDRYRRGKAKIRIFYRFCENSDCQEAPLFLMQSEI